MGTKECWGCGPDYKSAKSPFTQDEDDLIPMVIYGVDEFICPDCYDELPEDAVKIG